jgi:hypothetical protein
LNGQDNNAVYRDFGGGSKDDLTRSHAVNRYLLKSAFASDQRLLRQKNPTDFESFASPVDCQASRDLGAKHEKYGEQSGRELLDGEAAAKAMVIDSSIVMRLATRFSRPFEKRDSLRRVRPSRRVHQFH